MHLRHSCSPSRSRCLILPLRGRLGGFCVRTVSLWRCRGEPLSLLNSCAITYSREGRKMSKATTVVLLFQCTRYFILHAAPKTRETVLKMSLHKKGLSNVKKVVAFRLHFLKPLSVDYIAVVKFKACLFTLAISLKFLHLTLSQITTTFLSFFQSRVHIFLT